MRFKPLPEPVSVEQFWALQAAVPETPDSESSCCARLVAATEIETESAAADWLVFLRALELVETVDGQYRQRAGNGDTNTDTESLREAFRSRVFLADEVLTTLENAESPQSPQAVFDNTTTATHESESEAIRRIERLLEWAVVLGVADRRDDGYSASK